MTSTATSCQCFVIWKAPSMYEMSKMAFCFSTKEQVESIFVLFGCLPFPPICISGPLHAYIYIFSKFLGNWSTHGIVLCMCGNPEDRALWIFRGHAACSRGLAKNGNAQRVPWAWKWGTIDDEYHFLKVGDFFENQPDTMNYLIDLVTCMQWQCWLDTFRWNVGVRKPTSTIIAKECIEEIASVIETAGLCVGIMDHFPPSFSSKPGTPISCSRAT